MGADRLTSFSQVVLRFYESAQRVPVQEFQDGALQVIREIIPFDASMWGSATMSDQGIDIHTLHLYNTSQQMIEEYQKVKHLDQFAHEVASTERGTIRFRAEDAQALALREFFIPPQAYAWADHPKYLSPDAVRAVAVSVQA